uniref:Coproporphyrinogen III oxidase n=1 Tax=Meiothermus ruber TaxID=277 RepID=A0A7C3HHF6_MEIRU
MSKVIIVGGGLSGLAAAYWASEAGLEVYVVEAAHNLGGCHRTVTLEGRFFDLGDEYFDAQPSTLLELCSQVGLEPQPFPKLQRVVRLRGQDWVLPSGFNPATGYGLHQLATLPFGPGVKWRLAAERFVPAATVKDESLDAFVRRRLGLEIWEVLEPFLSAILGGPAEEAATPEAFAALLELERQGGLMVASRRLKTEGRWSLAGGMGSLVQALGTHLLSKARIFTGQEALAITRDKGRWQVHTPGGRLEAEAVVLALPAPRAARVFRPSAPQMTALLNQFPYRHSAKAFLLFRHTGPEAGPVEYYWAKTESYVGSSLRLSQLEPELTLALVQFIGDVAHTADAELSRLAQQDLSRYLQTQVRPLAAWVFRQPYSRPQFTPGHTRRLEALEQALVHAPGLFLTGSYLAGPGLARQIAYSHKITQHLLNFLALSALQAD